MIYLKVKWIHSLKNEPIFIYSELDFQRNEIRKVEIFKDGKCDMASEEIHTGETRLSLYPIPSIEEIRKDSQFEPEEIQEQEFEVIWKQAYSSLRN